MITLENLETTEMYKGEKKNTNHNPTIQKILVNLVMYNIVPTHIIFNVNLLKYDIYYGRCMNYKCSVQ